MPLGQCELVATAIAKHPALEVDLRLAKVSQLNKILLGAVRQSDMHLVDDLAGAPTPAPAWPGEPALAALDAQLDAAPGSANKSINSSE